MVDYPDLIPGAVDEILRCDPSVSVWRRVTKAPVTPGGVDLSAGEKFLLWLAAAGRDASVFPDPGHYEPERGNSRPTLAFRRGIHFCIGSALGRAARAGAGHPLPPEHFLSRTSASHGPDVDLEYQAP
ncbi:cytochrome P450 [Streptomyces sp. NPDC002144]